MCDDCSQVSMTRKDAFKHKNKCIKLGFASEVEAVAQINFNILILKLNGNNESEKKLKMYGLFHYARRVFESDTDKFNAELDILNRIISEFTL